MLATCLGYLSIAGVFIWATLSNGIPALRQDWSFPTTHAGEVAYFRAMYEGWIPVGLGAPQPVQSAFLLGFLGRAIAPFFSPWTLLFGYFGAIAWLVTSSSAKLFARLNAPAIPTIAGVALALLNPWVYTEVVAGHLFMIAAYGATIGVLAEFLRIRPRIPILVVLSIVVMLQLQFALPVDIVIFLYCLAHRQWAGAATLLLVASPSILGILAYHQQLLAIPYLLSWQKDQSVAPLQAIVFGGYSAHYADRMLAIARFPMLLFASLATVGTIFRFKESPTKWVAVATPLALLIVMGEKGPLAQLYNFAVTAIPETGVFRELFDLLAFVAVGYLVGFADCGARARRLSLLGVPAAAALLVAWVAFPPSSQWVNSAAIPPLAIAPSGDRFALFPAFQPLQFHGKGSGIDPDAAARFRPPSPLNEYLPTFPVDVALARYSLFDDSKMLGALGVSRIYDRPYFESNTAALQGSISRAGRGFEVLNRSAKSIRIDAIPLATLADRLVVASVANNPSRTAVFAGDVPPGLAKRFGLRATVTVRPIPPQRSGVDPNSGWVDARLAFVADPRLGQAFGGAYTQTAKKALSVPHAERVLTFVRGAMVAEGSPWRIDSTNGYRWVRLPNDVSWVRCLGRCAIALTGNVDAHMSRQGLPVHLTAVRSRWLTPWFLRVTIPRYYHEPMLRINEAFSPYWVAFVLPHSVLPHVRVDTSINGYLDPPTGSIYCIQVVAFGQLVLEIIAALWCLTLGAIWAKSSWSAKDAAQSMHS